MTQPVVLVIDDSQDIHDILAVRLKPEQVDLHAALEAQDGLARARALLPDLVLLDIDMPNMTGFEICQRLKADPITAAVPIIFLTGANEVHTKVQGFDLGAVDYVTKPFEPAELRARVRAALRTKRYHDLLATRAQIDGLTGLWNRDYFDRRLHEEALAAVRYERAVSLVLLDLDHFKRLNDDHGHPFGDRVLQAVGEILWGELRAVDAPCRYGGEELGLILTHTDLDGALVVGERVRAAIAGMGIRHKGAQVRVTTSVGVSSTSLIEPHRAITGELLVDLADQALYRAKRGGRDRVERASRCDTCPGRAAG
ncbi:MAG TPA: diguanylate cyclase [Kofleriaceae bacterium]|nr:diguanylate cyclase [Kofleriaceae bacterium]